MAPSKRPDLDAKIEGTKLTQSLMGIDQTLAKLNSTISQMQISNKLDKQMEGLVGRYGDDSARINMEYGKIQKQYMGSEAAKMQTQMQQMMQQQQQVMQQQAFYQQQLLQYKRNDAPPPTEQSMPMEAYAAGRMRNSNLNYMMSDYHKASSAGYFGDLVKNPYFTNQQNLTPAEYLQNERIEMRSVAESQDPAAVRAMLNQQRDLHNESQKAMLNQHLSTTMGVRGGISQRGDFESMTLPAVSGFAEDIGTSLDEAASVLRKMREIRVITQDLKSGKGMDVVNAVDDTALIFQKLSKLLGTTDVSKIVATSRQLANIGGGDFYKGLDVAQGIQPGIIGPFGDPRHSMGVAAAAGAQYDNLYGRDSQASMQAGAWDYRTRNLMSGYATGKHFNITGDPSDAAKIYAPFLASRGAGTQALIRAAGGGFDVMKGAEALAGEAGSNAVDFYMNLPNKMADAAKSQTGASAEYNLRKEIETYQREFGLSDNEALLSVFKGDARAANAYKEVQSAKDRYADEYENYLQAGRFSRLLTAGDAGGFRPGSNYDYSDPDMVTEGVATTRLGQMFKDLTVNPFYSARDMLHSAIPDWESYKESVYSDLADKVEVRKIDYGVDASFQTQLEKSNKDVIMHINSLLSNDYAAQATKDVIEKVAKGMGRFDFNDVKRILAAGLKGMAASGTLTDALKTRLSEYIASLTPNKAFKEIAPAISKDSQFYKLLQVAKDPDRISTLISSREQAMQVNIAGALLESGMSASEVNEIMPSDRMWAGRAAGFIEDFQGEFETAVTVGTTAGALFGPAGWTTTAVTTGIGLVAVPGAKLALETVESVSNWADTVVGTGLQARTALMEALGSGDAGAYEQELRAMLLMTRGMLDKTMALDLAGSIVAYISRLIDIYANSYRDKKESKKQSKEADYSDPFTPRELNAISEVAMQGLGGWSKNFKDLEKWVTVILGTINSRSSNVGKAIRGNPNPVNAANSVIKDLEVQAGHVSIGAISGEVSASTQFMANLADKVESGQQLAEFIPSITAGVDDTLAVKEQFENIENRINARATSVEEVESANEIMSTLREAAETGDYSKVRSIDTRLFKSSEKALGKEFVSAVERLTGEKDDTTIKRELMPLLAQISQESQQVVQEMSGQAQKGIELFNQMADIVMFNPEAQRKVVQLGQLLRGEQG